MNEVVSIHTISMTRKISKVKSLSFQVLTFFHLKVEDTSTRNSCRRTTICTSVNRVIIFQSLELSLSKFLYPNLSCIHSQSFCKINSAKTLIANIT